MKKEINCLDLFCGAGGFSYGFEKAGYNIVAGIDNDKDALVTFKTNHKNSEAIQLDLAEKIDFNSTQLRSIRDKKIHVIIGGPPCQGFSIAGKRIEDDPRNTLYRAYVDVVRFFKPEVVILENVPTIMSLFKGKVAQEIKNSFERMGYTCESNILDSSKFGVPQKRRRAFFVGVRKGNFSWPVPDDKLLTTTKQALSDLPLLDKKLGNDFISYKSKAKNEYQKMMREGSIGIYNHVAVDHTETTKKIISLVPDGGNYKDLPKSLQGTRKVNIAWTRMNSNKPCFTIDAGHNHHFHYKANRVPTVRECARIQSFDDAFIFHGNRGKQYRQVGNAVPPLLGKAIGISLRELLQ